VVAEVANLAASEAFRSSGGKHWLVHQWEDVENWSSMIIRFSDGSRATILATDIVLGGIKNFIEICMTNARLQCNIDPNNTMIAYTPDGEAFKDVEIAEKIETKTGYTFPSVGGIWFDGKVNELRDFVECVLDPERQPISDAQLARDVVRVIYAGYVSAEEGRWVNL